MFFTIGGFILLVLFASAVAGGVMIGWRTLQAASTRVKLDGIKTKIEVEKAQHQLRLTEHHHGKEILHLAALPEGESTKANPKKVEELLRKMEEEPELVEGEINLQPYTKYEWETARRMRQAATNAEFKPI
jgi:hypothetical protein